MCVKSIPEISLASLCSKAERIGFFVPLQAIKPSLGTGLSVIYIPRLPRQSGESSLRMIDREFMLIWSNFSAKRIMEFQDGMYIVCSVSF